VQSLKYIHLENEVNPYLKMHLSIVAGEKISLTVALHFRAAFSVGQTPSRIFRELTACSCYQVTDSQQLLSSN